MQLVETLKTLWELRGLFGQSLGLSLLIAFASLGVGFVIGILLAIVKISPHDNIIMKFLDKVASLYITVIRGTPMLVQLLIMYSVILVSLKYSNSNLIVPIISFGINSGAYMAEIFRSGICSVDKGQMEAGRSLGLSWMTTMFKVVIPQAIKVVIPTIFNEIITLIKETSVVSYIVLRIDSVQKYDLLGISEKLGLARPKFYFAFLFTSALLYLAVVMVLTFIQRILERRFAKSDRHS